MPDFDPNAFLAVPTQAEVTPAAARLIDLGAMQKHTTPQQYLAAVVMVHLGAVQQRVQAREFTADGGIYTTQVVDVLVVDAMLPPHFERHCRLMTLAELKPYLDAFEAQMRWDGNDVSQFGQAPDF